MDGYIINLPIRTGESTRMFTAELFVITKQKRMKYPQMFNRKIDKKLAIYSYDGILNYYGNE